MYTLNDFFCGCGGLGLGFQNAGFKIVGAWDFDKYAVATYRENVGDHVVQKAGAEWGNVSIIFRLRQKRSLSR